MAFTISGTTGINLATQPLTGQLPDANAPSGSVIQVVNVQLGTASSTTSQIPVDGSIPQSSEGAEVFTLSITPTSASSKLFVQVIISAAPVGSGWITEALFQDSSTNAAAFSNAYMPTSTGGLVVPLNYYMTAGTTSATTFKVRYGGTGGNTSRLNWDNGGLVGSSMTIMEIAA